LRPARFDIPRFQNRRKIQISRRYFHQPAILIRVIGRLPLNAFLDTRKESESDKGIL
jgi:hypothetical protein